jgi:hypothetical protein
MMNFNLTELQKLKVCHDIFTSYLTTEKELRIYNGTKVPSGTA